MPLFIGFLLFTEHLSRLHLLPLVGKATFTCGLCNFHILPVHMPISIIQQRYGNRFCQLSYIMAANFSEMPITHPICNYLGMGTNKVAMLMHYHIPLPRTGRYCAYSTSTLWCVTDRCANGFQQIKAFFFYALFVFGEYLVHNKKR